MEHDIFITALFLDPRFNFDLTDAQRETAFQHVVWLYKILEGPSCFHKWAMQNCVSHFSLADSPNHILVCQLLLYVICSSLNLNEYCTDSSTSNVFNDYESVTSLDDMAEMKYELVLKQKQKDLHCSNTLVPKIVNIYRLFQPEWAKLKEDVLVYWQNNRESFPELYKLAEIVFAVPGTQFPVERLFCQLKFIPSNLRNRLSSDIINNIMFLKCSPLSSVYCYLLHDRGDPQVRCYSFWYDFVL